MALRLVTLEGETGKDNLPETLNFISRDKNYALFGDIEDNYRFNVSLAGDEIEVSSFSPLYKDYRPYNEGTETTHQTLEGEDGVLWHSDKEGNLLGCSVCLESDELNGEEEEDWLHYNIDGSLAGYSIQRGQGHVTLSGGLSLDGFGFKGFKAPSFKAIKFKAPKIKAPKLPKFKAPKLKIKAPKIKFKAPKLNMNTKGLTKGISSIGKGVSKAVDSYTKGVSHIGDQIGKGVSKYVSNIAEGIGKVGDIASQVLDSAGGMLSDQQPGEEDTGEGEEENSDPTIPGYTDEDGYTDDDGLYYTNDGTLYQNPQTGEWFNIDGTPYGEEQEEQEAQIYQEGTELYGDIESAFCGELGFDLSSLASNPLVSTGLNAFLPGAGTAVSMVSSGVSASNAKKKAAKAKKKASLMSTLNKLTTAKKTNRPVAIVKSKAPARTAPVRPTIKASATAPDLSSYLNALNTPNQQQTEDKTKTYLMYGGGVVLFGGLVYLLTKKEGK